MSQAFVDPFAVAREQAIADLQVTVDGGHTIAGTEASGVAAHEGDTSTEGTVVDDVATSTLAEGETTAVVEDPTPGDPATPVSVTDPAQKPTTPVELKTWELKHRGKVVPISDESEVVELAQKGFDYQTKTQELAQRERELEAKWAEKEAALRQFLGKKEMVRAYLEDLETLDLGGPDPDQPLTAAQAQALVAQEVGKAREADKQAQAKQAYSFQVNTLTHQYRTEVDKAVSDALAANPALGQFIDGVEVLLLADVAPVVAAQIQANPDVPVDLKEVKALIAAAAVKRAGKLKALEVNAQKVAAVAAAKMKQSSPAPAGGSPAKQAAAPQAKFKLGDKGLLNAAIADLQKGRGV